MVDTVEADPQHELSEEAAESFQSFDGYDYEERYGGGEPRSHEDIYGEHTYDHEFAGYDDHERRDVNYAEDEFWDTEVCFITGNVTVLWDTVRASVSSI